MENRTLTIPVGIVSVLLIGPGVSVTHAGVALACQMKCILLWVGDTGCFLYASSGSEDRDNANFLKQIKLHDKFRDRMALRLFCKRFSLDYNPRRVNFQKIMGMEGALVRKAYLGIAKKYGIPWEGRKIHGEWASQAIYNKAISVGNSCLYGLVSSCLQAMGYSSALGVIHQGNMMSLVFDIADLYKLQYVVPLAFRLSSLICDDSIEPKMREEMRKLFVTSKFMEKVVMDVEDLFDENNYH
jgi:CRISPR-associated protein Cas1